MNTMQVRNVECGVRSSKDATPRNSFLNSALRTPHSALRRGFTMVEIAICLAVIGFALVAIIGVLPIGMSVQKDNREETLINFDAHYLMDAIRSGSLGQDSLTNYVISITNVATLFNSTTQAQSIITNWYNTFTNGAKQFYSHNGKPVTTTILTNGFNILGLLTTPKYTLPLPGRGVTAGSFISNYITADFRAISGGASDQGVSQTSRDFAFAYRIYPEIIPIGVADPSLTNFQASGLSANDILARSNSFALAPNLQNNLAEIRVRFRCPLLPNGQTGTGSEVYRTSVAGQINSTNAPWYFFAPQSYAATNLTLP